MSDGSVELQYSGDVARIILNRPQAHNSLTWPMYESIFDACLDITRLSTISALVLSGAGDESFCAGSDIHQFEGFLTGDDGLAYESRMERVLRQLEMVHCPTIAAIDGFALGGGLLLASVCDFRVATQKSRFGVPIARTLGNALSGRNCSRLISLVGVGRAKDLLMTGRVVGAPEALDMGLLTYVAPDGELSRTVESLVEQLLRSCPQTLRATKTIIDRLNYGMMEDIDVLHSVYGHANFHEGVTAFIGHRRPAWKR